MEKIVITGSKIGAGKSTTAFNLAYGLAIEGRSVGIIEFCKEKSYIAELMGADKEKFLKPQVMHGIIKLMVVPEERANIESEIFKEEFWEDVDYLLIDIPLKEEKLIQLIGSGKSLIILEAGEEFEIESEKSLEMLKNSELEIIGIVENKVSEYKHEVKSKYNIISRIPVEAGLKKENYDGIPHIYKNFNSYGIIELKEITDRIIDFEYGEEEAAVKKIMVGVCIDENGNVADREAECKEILKVKIDGMLYRVEENIKVNGNLDGIELLIITGKEEKNKSIENRVHKYIEEINKEKRHQCH